jgi:ketosteroid isomerase-like protein
VKTPREVVQEWVAAYNQRDARAAAELYHEDAMNFQVALGAPSVGRHTILDDLLSFFHAFPDNFTHVENLFEDGEWAMLEWFGAGRVRWDGPERQVIHVTWLRVLLRYWRQDRLPTWIFRQGHLVCSTGHPTRVRMPCSYSPYCEKEAPRKFD